jgi:type II secretion system protein C
VPRFKAARFDVQQIVAAHLFGAPAKHIPTGADADTAPDTQLALALSGIMATKDPQTGYAILGEQGKATHFYRVGAPLEVARGGRLFRVFTDRVVLDFDGRLETLRLPHYRLPDASPPSVRVAAAASAEPDSAPVQDSPPAGALAAEVTPAQSTFSLLDAERRNVDGHMDGMVLHPSKRYQRQYGLRDGDTLTAVNGVTLTDPDALANALKDAGKALSLTFVRDGVQQTKSLRVND